MGGILLLLVLCAVMTVASFLAGLVPLSMVMSTPRLRLVSSIGVGILVGTSLIVIIPEGIETVAASVFNPASVREGSTTHPARDLTSLGNTFPLRMPNRVGISPDPFLPSRLAEEITANIARSVAPDVPVTPPPDSEDNMASGSVSTMSDTAKEHKAAEDAAAHDHDHDDEVRMPTFYIGLSLVTGFVLMFLIDRLPRHAVERLKSAPTTRHISLDNLASSSLAGVGEEDDDDLDGSSEGFLGSLTPSPRQSRGLATTTGLVIHAAADGIAMGASATTDDMKLGLVIFVAIMVHKAPAAFGLTSVLLRHGISKRAVRGHLAVFSLAAPLGALLTWVIVTAMGGNSANMEGPRGQYWTGMLLLFSAGTFLYVAMQAMQEDGAIGGGGGGMHDHHGLGNGYEGNGVNAQRKQARPQMRDTLATLAGMLLPLLTQFGHHH